MSVTTTHKLVYGFRDGEGENITMSYRYASPEVEESDAVALANSIVTNGSIFENAPVSVKSAKLVSTTETTFDVSA